MSLRKGSYRRPRYSATAVNMGSNSESSESIVNKGDGDIDRSIEQLDSILTELRQSSHLNIKDLPVALQERYRQAVAYVSMLYDTDYYPALSEVVSKRFGDIETFQPGTVGAYFGGCLSQNTIKGVSPGCTPTCVNSAPPSAEQAERTGWSPCEQNVILGTMVNGRYNFSKMNDIQNRQDAIIYINQPTFTGFTAGEKRQLQQLGVEEVIILNYQNDQYKELLPSTSLDEIQIRNNGVGAVVEDTSNVSNIWNGVPTGNNPNITSPNTMWIILLAILVLIILFLLWRNWETVVII